MNTFGTELTRSDLRMFLQAMRNGWPVEPRTITNVEAFCISARLTRSGGDRLLNLAGEVLAVIEQHRLESLMETERERDRAAGLYNADCGAIAPEATD